MGEGGDESRSNMNGNSRIELIEYSSKLLPAEEISINVGTLLFKKYSDQIAIEFPSPATDNSWRITSQGWVGYIPLPEGIVLVMKPKVDIHNIFSMMEYAYRLKSFSFLKGIVQCDCLEGYFDRLACILARLILDRSRVGLYRSYVSCTETQSFVVGRIDFTQVARNTYDHRLVCEYQEHTADIPENQILCWTLNKILRAKICGQGSVSAVRAAYRALSNSVSLIPYDDKNSMCVSYHRLNQDYYPMHALCRFFLGQMSPSHEEGKTDSLPFLVNMAKLFELFVAEWLRAHLPEQYELKVHERFDAESAGKLLFSIDLVICHRNSGIAKAVLDTKYKRTQSPDTRDIQQVTTYALAMGCADAILIYPTQNIDPIDLKIGEIRVRSLPFSLDQEIEKAGEVMMEAILN